MEIVLRIPDKWWSWRLWRYYLKNPRYFLVGKYGRAEVVEHYRARVAARVAERDAIDKYRATLSKLQEAQRELSKLKRQLR